MTEPLRISASQLGTFSDCERKWWLERMEKLPVPPRGYLVFGTVLHACLERWASGDEQGRVPPCLDPFIPLGQRWGHGPLTGQVVGDPVDVFPPGWETVEERGVKLSVTPNEAALIRKLVERERKSGPYIAGEIDYPEELQMAPPDSHSRMDYEWVQAIVREEMRNNLQICAFKKKATYDEPESD